MAKSTQCKVPESARQCQRVDQLDIDVCHLEIKPEALARLLQSQQLTINDFQCADSNTKQFVQAVLLNCIVCSSCTTAKPLRKNAHR